MSLPSSISPHHINTYHHSNSLLFQFILIEFIEISDSILRLEMLCNKKPTQDFPSESLKAPTTEANRQQIDAILAKLIGAKRGLIRLLAWNPNDGQLAKLKTYCGLFLQNAVADEKELIALQHYADKISAACLLASDALIETPHERHPFLAAVDKISSAMLRFSKLLARIIPQFRDDENVVLFLLRYKESLDKIYGNRFVAKLLCRMYPKGLRETKQFLTQRYTSRGFDHVLRAIAVKINELEAAAT